MSEHALEVPNFGILKGTSNDGIAEFQNVQYAEVVRRFAPAQPIDRTNTPLKQFDCTSPGPLSPQKGPFNDDFNGVPSDECAPLHLRYDEKNCLNFRMQLPLGYSNLPVVIWLHGGSNVAGTPYRGSSQAHSWLKRAIKLDKPFIIISPHYRVGLFGWLPWDPSTKAVPSSLDDSKHWYNQAIGDQRLVIEWVLKHGASIGADTSRISLVGQSAGASNVYAHLINKWSTQHVHQFGLLSGQVGAASLTSCDSYARLAERIAEHANCTVGELETIDYQKILQAQAELGIESFAAVKPPKHTLAEPSSAPRLIVGDCLRDGHFFNDVPEAVSATPEGYETCEFYTQVFFRSGANEVWDSYPEVLRHMCDGVNPYQASWGNNHMVELHYIINGYDIKNNAAINTTQDTWARLIHLETPWDPKNEVFYIPFEGAPGPIPAAEAREKRPLTTQNVDVAQMNRFVRGW